jgi:hypothetical protein
MTPSQLERLKRHAKETKHYIFRLEKQGKEKTATKVKQKYEFLTSCISELEAA